MDDDGEQRDLTFDDLEAYTRWPYTDGQLFLAMMTAVVKFSPRYAKVVIRTERLYMLDEDLEIVDLTTLARAPTRPHRSQRRRRGTSSTATSSMRYEPLPPHSTVSMHTT